MIINLIGFIVLCLLAVFVIIILILCFVEYQKAKKIDEELRRFIHELSEENIRAQEVAQMNARIDRVFEHLSEEIETYIGRNDRTRVHNWKEEGF